jgi:hypothetical protein
MELQTVKAHERSLNRQKQGMRLAAERAMF